jgi:hypothetical protein
MGRNMHKELEALAGIEVPSLKDFWTWVNMSFKDSYKDEVHEYLSQSVDHYDLERRIRLIERRGML